MIHKIPQMIMLVGLPASGKSGLALEIKKKKPLIKIHSSDSLRKELYQDENEQAHNKELFIELHRRIKKDLTDGFDVCYDATNINKKRRISFLKELKNIKCIKICILILEPYEICQERNASRERIVPKDIIKKMYMQFQPPHYSEGWDDISLLIDTNNPNFNNGKYCASNLFDGKHGINNFPQENSHHKLSLGHHCLKTYQYISEKYPNNDLLSIAALFHDIGKVFTKTKKNSKGVDDGDFHYYQHHCVSAYDSFFYMKYSGMNTENMLYVSNLIYYHMHPFICWKQSEKAKKKDRKLIGEQMFEDVLKLHEADIFAH